MPLYSFEPYFKYKFQRIPVQTIHLEKVLEWYRKQINDLLEEDCFEESIQLRFISIFDNRITIETENYVNNNTLEIMIDPDNDGNYPINIEGKDYLIIGKDMKLETWYRH
jgi:hypothetical protein